MSLHQLNLGFDARQDRLLLRVSTTDAREFRFWLTRRMVQRAWPQLVKVMQAAPTPAPEPTAGKPPRAQAAEHKLPLEFRHAAAVQQADFATPYAQQPLQSALPGEPLLVSRLSLKPLPDGRSELVLADETGPSVTLTVDAPVLHGLVKLVQDTARAADWQLSLELPQSVAASKAIN